MSVAPACGATEAARCGERSAARNTTAGPPSSSTCRATRRNHVHRGRTEPPPAFTQARRARQSKARSASRSRRAAQTPPAPLGGRVVLGADDRDRVQRPVELAVATAVERCCPSSAPALHGHEPWASLRVDLTGAENDRDQDKDIRRPACRSGAGDGQLAAGPPSPLVPTRSARGPLRRPRQAARARRSRRADRVARPAGRSATNRGGRPRAAEVPRGPGSTSTEENMRERYGDTLGLAGGRRKRRGAGSTGAGSRARYVHDETREPGLGHKWDRHQGRRRLPRVTRRRSSATAPTRWDRAIPSSPRRSRIPALAEHGAMMRDGHASGQRTRRHRALRSSASGGGSG